MTWLGTTLRESGLNHFMVTGHEFSQTELLLHFKNPDQRVNLEKGQFPFFWIKRELAGLERHNAFVKGMRKRLNAELRARKLSRSIRITCKPIENFRNESPQSPLGLLLVSRNEDGKQVVEDLASTLVKINVKRVNSWQDFIKLSKLNVGLIEKI